LFFLKQLVQKKCTSYTVVISFDGTLYGQVFLAIVTIVPKELLHIVSPLVLQDIYLPLFSGYEDFIFSITTQRAFSLGIKGAAFTQLMSMDLH
jgi:hypothetical protein